MTTHHDAVFVWSDFGGHHDIFILSRSEEESEHRAMGEDENVKNFAEVCLA